MKLYAQHGYGEGEKISNGLSEESLDGAIYSPRDVSPEKFKDKVNQVRQNFPGADILLDPQFYISPYAHRPNAKLGKLEEWDFFKPYRRGELEIDEAVERILSEFMLHITDLPVTGVIAPNIYIPKSFDSIEAAIAKNFIRRTRIAFDKMSNDTRVYATLAISAQALANREEFESFMNDITLLVLSPRYKV